MADKLLLSITKRFLLPKKFYGIRSIHEAAVRWIREGNPTSPTTDLALTLGFIHDDINEPLWIDNTLKVLTDLDIIIPSGVKLKLYDTLEGVWADQPTTDEAAFILDERRRWFCLPRNLFLIKNIKYQDAITSEWFISDREHEIGAILDRGWTFYHGTDEMELQAKENLIMEHKILTRS